MAKTDLFHVMVGVCVKTTKAFPDSLVESASLDSHRRKCPFLGNTEKITIFKPNNINAHLLLCQSWQLPNDR
jgi:hypothetical protein